MQAEFCTPSHQHQTRRIICRFCKPGEQPFRNVKLTKPNEKYVEVWNDEGDDNMLAVMKELIKNNYKRLIMPEHPRSVENDKGQKNGGYTGWVYNVGYARAMMQVALMELRKS